MDFSFYSLTFKILFQKNYITIKTYPMKSKPSLMIFSVALITVFLVFFSGSTFAVSILEFVPDEVIVQYRHSASANQQQARKSMLRRALRQTILTENKQAKGKGELAVLKLSTPARSAKELAETLQNIRRDPDIEYAEPNWILHKLNAKPADKPKAQSHSVFDFPNDRFFRNGESWGMYGDNTSPANPYGSGAGEAWLDLNKPLDCSDVYIGVLDEGIMHTHPDLKDSIWVNRYDPVDGKDNDGNGYIDDSNGWDFYHNDQTIYDQDEDRHGTHVAGIIAAAGDNGIGIAGICWKTKLISAKFLGPDGGTTANAIKAIDYLTGLKIRHGLNIVATNNSWGGGGYSRAMIEAIKRAETQNILFVAAAGNDGADNDAYPLYPASYPNANIISVAALSSTGMLSGYSNFGYRSVDIAAPGEGIISTIPYKKGEPGYGYDSGTSMAAPFVTGAAALLAHKHRTANAKRIKQAILKGAAPTKALYGMTSTGGRLDIPKLLFTDALDLLKNIFQDIKDVLGKF